MPKVLIIEDSPVQGQALQQFLELRGLTVRQAPNGPAGIELAQQWSPDAIVLDVKMDRMDGFEVCRRLQGDENTSHIPIIMLTVLNDPDTRRQSLSVGAVDFIPKDSFMNTVLLETLRQLEVLTEQDSGDNDTK